MSKDEAGSRYRLLINEEEEAEPLASQQSQPAPLAAPSTSMLQFLSDERVENLNNIINSNPNEQCNLSPNTCLSPESSSNDNTHDESNYLLVNNRYDKRRGIFFKFLHSVDILLSIVLFSPLVSIFWYVTWSFLDDYFLNRSSKLSNLVSWLLGLFILLPSYVFQKDLQRWYTQLENTRFLSYLLRVTMRVVYIYLVTVAVILEVSLLFLSSTNQQ
jgi:hypothetical protein